MHLRYTPPGQTEPVEVEGRLKDQQKPVTTGQKMLIRVSREDPTRWTDRERVDWGRVLLLPGFVTLAGLPLLGAAAWSRRRVLRVWREGEAMEGTVIEVRQAAANPLSRVVRYVLTGQTSSRVYSAVVPNRVGVPQPGESIWLVAEPTRPQGAIAAAAYL